MVEKGLVMKAAEYLQKMRHNLENIFRENIPEDVYKQLYTLEKTVQEQERRISLLEEKSKRSPWKIKMDWLADDSPKTK